MAAIQWIHCNLCYYMLSQKGRKFYTTSCLHVICKNCTIHSNRGTLCPVCKRQGIRLAEICNSMDSKIKKLFSPTVASEIESLLHALNFQYKQKQHLITKIIATEDKMDQLEQAEQDLKQKIANCLQNYKKLRSHRKSLEEQLSSPEFAFRNSKTSPQFFDSPSSDGLRTSSGASSSSSSNKSEGFGSSSSGSDQPGRRHGRLASNSKPERHSKRSANLPGSGSQDSSRDSFLDMKRFSTPHSSDRSVNFGTTPSSGANSTSNISKMLHGMAISRDDDF
ncbi:RING finger protein narya-like isoform X2 [Wyeomyia smithii]|uniref:RING finger protein narya-like isoform X2 n=1 Tax=Wyeomyia smithii TaxID=174621 RepID=UPI002467CF45|nr:RING finger protein narya-like isoform X2 [Wyeomyia smithii]